MEMIQIPVASMLVDPKDKSPTGVDNRYGEAAAEAGHYARSPKVVLWLQGVSNVNKRRYKPIRMTSSPNRRKY